MSPVGKLSIRVEAFTPRTSNTLRGFCTITIPELHLKVYDITVHRKGAARWVGLPAKPQIGRDGSARRDEHGKTLYAPILEFTDKPTRDAFSARVVAAVAEFAPAFEEEVA